MKYGTSIYNLTAFWDTRGTSCEQRAKYLYASVNPSRSITVYI